MKNVLVVDDVSAIREYIAIILENEGYHVIGKAADGIAAVEKCKELKPDIVIMDMQMPRMNGLDSIKEIIKIDSKVKVLVVTGEEEEAVRAKTVSSCVKGAIIKPFMPQALVKAVANL